MKRVRKADEFGERLRNYMFKEGITCEELSEWMNLNLFTIQNYYYGVNYPTCEGLKKLCLVLGVTADFLLFGTEDELL